MPIWTTYLSNWTNNKEKLLKFMDATSEEKKAVPYFVMRGRGNDEVAPTVAILNHWKEAENKFKEGKLSQKELDVAWSNYCKAYRRRLVDLYNEYGAFEWEGHVASESGDEGLNVVLICFEKDPKYCHRRLLGEFIELAWKEEIPKLDYRGELPSSDALKVLGEKA